MSLQVTEKVTLLPAVAEAQHGQNAVHNARSVFDSLGRLLWQKSPRGFITFFDYDVAAGLLKRRIEDVDVAKYNESLGGGGQPQVPSGWVTPEHGGAHTETKFEHDAQGRVVEERGPRHFVQLTESDTAVSQIRSAAYHVYDDVNRQRRTARGYKKYTSSGDFHFTVGWISVQNMDAAGRVVEEFEAVRPGSDASMTASGKPALGESLPPSSWRRLRRHHYDLFGKLAWTRVYHQLEVSGDGLSIVEGSEGTHYTQTSYGYDVMDRQIKVTDASGTITRTVFDGRGQVLSRWIGTDDTGATDSDPRPAGLPSNSPNNMVKVETLIYSATSGLITEHRRHVSDSEDRSEFFAYDEYDRLVKHQRGTGSSALLEVHTYDRQNRTTQTQRYYGLSISDALDASKCLGIQDREFDTRGLVFRETAYAAATGSTPVPSGPGMITERWFDASGNVIKQTAPGSEAAQKVLYDGMERGMARYVVLEVEAPPPGSDSDSTSDGSSSGSEDSSSNSSDSVNTDDSSSGSGSTTLENQNALISNFPGIPRIPVWIPGGSDSSSDSSSGGDPGGSSSSSGPELPGDPDPVSSSDSSSSVSFSSVDLKKTGPAACSCCCDCDDKDPSQPSPEDPSGTKGSEAEKTVEKSSHPIRFSDGSLSLDEHDLSSSGLSFKFGITRSYASLTDAGTGLFGRGWHVEELPVLQRAGSDIVILSGGTSNEWYSPVGASTSQYVDAFGGLSTLVREAATAELPARWVLTTRSGSQRIFFDTDDIGELEPRCAGRLMGLVNRNGETVWLKWRDGDGSGAPETVDFVTAGGRQIRYAFAIHGAESGPGSYQRVASVTHSVNAENHGALVGSSRALYSYWNDGDFGGPGGCLRTVTIQHFDPTSNQWRTVREHHYRYYLDGDPDGPARALKYVFGPASIEAMRHELPAWDNIADGRLLHAYADQRFSYDEARRVRRERVDGYETKFDFSWLHAASPSSDLNAWHNMATESRPDGSTVRVISNAAGHSLFREFYDPVQNRHYRHAWKYNSDGRLLESIPHSAISAASLPADSSSAWTLASAVTLRTTGPVTVVGYDSSGRIESQSVRAGSSSGALTLRTRTYHTLAGSAVKPLASETVHYGAGITSTVHFAYRYLSGPAAGDPGAGVDIETPVANEVAGDVVFEQEKPGFDEAGNVILTTRWQRLHSTPATDTGELHGPASTAGPQALRSYTAFWPDGLGRVHTTADFGTFSGNPFSRSAVPVAPAASSGTVLVSRSRWLVSGATEAYESVATDGTITRWENDAAGRRTCLIENYNPAKGPAFLDFNRRTEFNYHSSGQLSTLTARNRKSADPSHPESQITRWSYGTTLAESGIATNHLLRAKIYPDSDDLPGPPPTNGSNGSYRRSEFAYNRLGEVLRFTDPAGTVHDYSFDLHGRLTVDAVTTLGSAVDNYVLRINRSYSDDGRSVTITSWDRVTPVSANVRNEVKLDYNQWGQLTSDWQAHAGIVTGSTPRVQYGYHNAASAPLNSLRRTSMMLPSGKVVGFVFNSAASPFGADFDSRLSRLSAVGYHQSGTTTPELAFTYAGVAMPVRMKYPQPLLQWSLLPQGTETDYDGRVPYTGVDPFGRLLRARWLTDPASGSPQPVVDVRYGYDTGSRRTSRRAVPDTSTTPELEFYSYDGLSQVTGRRRGLLNATGSDIASPATVEEQFAFDTLGNWESYNVLKPVSGSPAVYFGHTRSHNEANQITGFSNTTQPVTHDAAGNCTRSAPVLESNGDIQWNASHQYTWDAWNRLVRITRSDTGAEVALHAYDGLTRRTTLKENGSGPVRHFYYNDQWRSVEETLDASSTVDRRHLFNPLNRWHLIQRYRNTGAGETLYCLHDAMDPVAITSDSGSVLERFSYSAFGMRRVMDADFEDKMGGTAWAWNWEFHAEFSDGASGLHNYGWRYFSPLSGKWVSRDSIGERAGLNLGSACGNNMICFRDYVGLASLSDGVAGFITTYPKNPESFPFTPLGDPGALISRQNPFNTTRRTQRDFVVKRISYIYEECTPPGFYTRREVSYLAKDATRFGLSPGSRVFGKPYSSTATPVDHAIGPYRGPYHSVSERPGGSTRVGGEPYPGELLTIDPTLLNPGSLIDNETLTSEIDEAAKSDPSVARRSETWKNVQKWEKEALIRGHIPPEAIYKSPKWVRVGSKCARVVGGASTAYSGGRIIGAAAVSFETGDMKPLKNESLREGGAMGGSLLGGAGAGALLGCEFGPPGALLGGLVGAIAGGIFGYNVGNLLTDD